MSGTLEQIAEEIILNPKTMRANSHLPLDTCPKATTTARNFQFCNERICPYAQMQGSGTQERGYIGFGTGCACEIGVYQKRILKISKT
jgi:hypothetical protein